MLAKLTYKLISEIGVREKYIRKDHYNTIKVWWARRPITAMRSLLIKEMMLRNKDGDQCADVRLFSEVNPPNALFVDFARRYSANALSVLDVFSGGGSIPLESARLGFKTYSSELNPVASLLSLTHFQFWTIQKN